MLFLAFLICILYLKPTLNAKLLTSQKYSLKEKRVNTCPFDAWILNLDCPLNSGLNRGLTSRRFVTLMGITMTVMTMMTVSTDRLGVGLTLTFVLAPVSVALLVLRSASYHGADSSENCITPKPSTHSRRNLVWKQDSQQTLHLCF